MNRLFLVVCKFKTLVCINQIIKCFFVTSKITNQLNSNFKCLLKRLKIKFTKPLLVLTFKVFLNIDFLFSF
jgi:hypothetical protein